MNLVRVYLDFRTGITQIKLSVTGKNTKEASLYNIKRSSTAKIARNLWNDFKKTSFRTYKLNLKFKNKGPSRDHGKSFDTFEESDDTMTVISQQETRKIKGL